MDAGSSPLCPFIFFLFRFFSSFLSSWASFSECIGGNYYRYLLWFFLLSPGMRAPTLCSGVWCLRFPGDVFVIYHRYSVPVFTRVYVCILDFGDRLFLFLGCSYEEMIRSGNFLLGLVDSSWCQFFSSSVCAMTIIIDLLTLAYWCSETVLSVEA